MLHLACGFLLLLASPSQQEPVQASLSKDITSLPPPSEEQAFAAQTLNGFRAIHGLEPVSIDRRLLACSKIHAANMAKFKRLDHKEDTDVLADVLKRANSFGYTGPVSELVASGVPSSPYAVVNFMDAPYHRRLLLRPGNFDFGCSENAGYICFVLGGSALERTVYSPPDGTHGVPTGWDGREDPSPMRGVASPPPFGYPVTMTVYGEGNKLESTEGQLCDSRGQVVEAIVRTPQNDDLLKDTIVIVPLRPLRAESDYTATVTYTLDGEVRTKSWSFRTGTEAPVHQKSKHKQKG